MQQTATKQPKGRTSAQNAKPFPVTKRQVWEAWKRVKKNQGGAGIDDQTIAEFEEHLDRQSLQDLESDGIGELSSQAGPPGEHSKVERRRSTAGDSDRGGSGGTDGGEAGTGADPGTGVSSRFVRISTEEIGP